MFFQPHPNSCIPNFVRSKSVKVKVEKDTQYVDLINTDSEDNNNEDDGSIYSDQEDDFDSDEDLGSVESESESVLNDDYSADDTDESEEEEDDNNNNDEDFEDEDNDEKEEEEDDGDLEEGGDDDDEDDDDEVMSEADLRKESGLKNDLYNKPSDDYEFIGKGTFDGKGISYEQIYNLYKQGGGRGLVLKLKKKNGQGVTKQLISKAKVESVKFLMDKSSAWTLWDKKENTVDDDDDDSDDDVNMKQPSESIANDSETSDANSDDDSSDDDNISDSDDDAAMMVDKKSGKVKGSKKAAKKTSGRGLSGNAKKGAKQGKLLKYNGSGKKEEKSKEMKKKEGEKKKKKKKKEKRVEKTVKKVEVIDSDNDSLSTLGSEDLKSGLQMLTNEASQASGNTFPFSLTSPFFNPKTNDNIKVGIMGSPGGTFMMKASVILPRVRNRFEKKGGKLFPKAFSLGLILQDGLDVKVREEPYSVSTKYKRSKSQKTSEQVIFIFVYPASEEGNFNEYLDYIMNKLFVPVMSEKQKPGYFALQAAKLQSNTNSPGGLYNWLVNNVGHGDEDTAVKNLSKRINDHYCGGPVFTYDDSLDKVMTDYDIKQFVMKYLGATSWDDLSDDEKKVCYKNYPKRKLPVWTSIFQESY